MHLGPARTVLVGCGLLVLTNGPVFYVANRVLDNGMSWEEPFTRSVFIALAVAAVTTVALDRQRVDGGRLFVPHPLPAGTVAFLAVWMVASSLWSLTPELTRGRSLLYVGLAAFAWIVADLEFPEFRRALLGATTVAVVASLVAVLVSDSIGLDRNDDWRGIYTNRNSLAPVSGVAIIVGLGRMAEVGGRRRLFVGLAPALAVVTMLGSGSRTAWLALAVAGGGAFLVVAARTLGDRRGAWIPRVALGAGVAGVAATVAIVATLWNEPTFAQRRTIWSLVWDRIGERPLHGFGWFNVWTDPTFTAADPLLGRGSAHGSFLEVWLGLGLVGLVPFLLVVGLALHTTATDAWRRPSVATWTWLALVLFLVIENLTESFVLWFSYNWVLLTAAALRFGAVRRRRPVDRTPEPSASATS